MSGSSIPAVSAPLTAREAPREPAQLSLHNCLRYAYHPFKDGWHFDAPDGQTVAVRVSGNLISASAETLRITVLSGQGILLAPGFIVGDDLLTGGLVPIMSPYRPVEMTMNAVYPHRHHLSAKVRGFIDLWPNGLRKMRVGRILARRRLR